MPLSTSTNENSGILALLGIHGLITLVLSLLTLRLINLEAWQNFMIGQLYVWILLISLSLTVQVFFWKKSIALLVLVIVFKWPILIYLVVQVTELVDIVAVPLSFGFLPIVLSSLIWALTRTE